MTTATGHTTAIRAAKAIGTNVYDPAAHPVPWSELDYDPGVGGYVVSFSIEQLKSAPSDSIMRVRWRKGAEFSHL